MGSSLSLEGWKDCDRRLLMAARVEQKTSFEC